MLFMNKQITKCHFHITSYLTELYFFRKKDVLCDAYHKEHASH